MNGEREWLKKNGARANVYVPVAGIAIFSCVVSEAKWNRQTVKNRRVIFTHPVVPIASLRPTQTKSACQLARKYSWS
jgi:hypothetical protein